MTRSSSGRRTRARTRRVAPLVLATLLAIGGVAAWRAEHAAPPSPQQKDTPKAPANQVVLPQDASQLAFLKLEAAGLAPLPASDPMNARLALAEDRTARIFPPLAGRILALKADPGDAVVSGTPLAILDAPDFGQAVADLRKAQADATLKKKALARAQTLFGGEALARRDLEAAQADARAADAEADRARLRLANLAPPGSRIEGQRLVLRAPLGGVVVDRQANPGTEVRPDAATPLFILSDLRRLWLNIDLPEQAAALAKPGAAVNFSVEAFPGEEFSARIERVGAMVDPTTRRIPVRALVDNGDGRLKPEMFARATISDPKAATVLRVPVGALLTDGLTTRLFVQLGPRTFERRRVSVARQDAEFAYLTPDSGLKPGDKVVVRGALLLASELAQGE
ncbi:MAG: efflux RND transporter periplasmic adaptor subunit [Betaproteobacteria bacterium]|nr:efflux RND transporter periplasmic adaptor subunit [Betaproteobacteria bacterium]